MSIRPAFAAAVVACAAAVFTIPCGAAAQRTFVATTGADANTSFNCSLVHSCRSFAAALTVTTTGGEIIVLNSGGYGPVTINKSVALIAPPGVYAGISVLDTTPGLTGIVINAGASGRVTLRGLSLVSVGTSDNKIGIDVQSAAHVRIEACTLDGFSSGVNSYANAASVAISDTTLRGSDEGIGTMGAAIGVYGAYDARLVVTRSIINNTRTGIYVGRVHHAEITDTTIAYCEFAGVLADAFAVQPDNGSLIIERVALLENYIGIAVGAYTPGRLLVANVRNSTISGNNWGISVRDGGYVRLAANQITANHTAIERLGSGGVASLGDNLCVGNDAPCIAVTSINPY